MSGIDAHAECSLGPEPVVVAYLYHDAASAEAADPLLHSTMLVLAADRRQTLRNETPLVTLANAQAMVAAERERLLVLVEAVRNANRDAEDADTFRLLKPGQERAWLALLAGLKGHNAQAKPGPTQLDLGSSAQC